MKTKNNHINKHRHIMQMHIYMHCLFRIDFW